MKILVVEDDPATASMVKSGLTADLHNVELASDGKDGAFLGKNYTYDVIILDYSLPGKDGLSICKEIRALGKTTPILFLSVNNDTTLKVSALNAGADDFMTKPFSIEELRARIKALTRRAQPMQNPLIHVDDIELDTEKQIVRRGGQMLNLTRKEFNLLEYLMRHAGTVVSRAMIMEHVWSVESDPFSNTVEVHIRNLRKKLNNGNKSDLINNVPGRGYVIDTGQNLA